MGDDGADLSASCERLRSAFFQASEYTWSELRKSNERAAEPVRIVTTVGPLCPERELLFSTLTKYPMSLRGFLRLASSQMSPGSAPIAMKQEGTRPKGSCLIVQDNAQKGRINVEPGVVLDEARFFEFVHEKIDTRAGCADHFGQHLLRYFGDHLLGLIFFAVTCEQQKSTREPFLAGIKKLIHQVL